MSTTLVKLSALAAVLLLAANSSRAATAEPPAAAAHVDKARELAGSEFAHSLFLCDPQGTLTIASAALKGSDQWLPPTWAFDDLGYVGSAFVGVWVLRTSAGLILFDSGESTAEVQTHILPGLRQLGLDPAAIRFVVVTHGHWDHYGGAKYLQETYGSRIAMSAEDWDLMYRLPPGSIERAPMFGPDRADRPPPRRDMVIHDGEKLRLGDKTVVLYVTPGHTPGTLSALIPVKEGGTPHLLSLLGGTAFPRTLEPTSTMGGLRAFSASVERLSKLSQGAGADGIINTHIFVDGSLERLEAAHARKAGEANPFVLGKEAVKRYYAMFDECLEAAAERPVTPLDLPKFMSGSEAH
jgi:metallo-beta-lactamase class B